MLPLLLLIILVGLVILLIRKWQQRSTINRWRRALDLEQHHATFQQLYADLDGFALSKAARTSQDAIEYVYGEIIFEPFIALLSLCKPNSSTIFYDLGSGTGKAVLACAMVFDVKKSCGIELFASLCQSAKAQQQRLKEIPVYQARATRIEFKQGNIIGTPFDEATLIFINATAFFGENWQAISKQVEQVKPGCLVISTSKSLVSNLFTTLRVTQVTMTWGIVDAYIQERIGNCDEKITQAKIDLASSQ